MKKVVFVLMSILMFGVLASAAAQGMSKAQAEAAGFDCVDVGDTLGHCSKERSGNEKATPVLVFSSMDAEANLIATEILVDPAIYHGQPCPSEGLDEWLDLGFARACHHYVGPK